MVERMIRYMNSYVEIFYYVDIVMKFRNLQHIFLLSSVLYKKDKTHKDTFSKF